MKIAVMGYSGAGKSTLAKKLGRLYDCPVLYLDRIQFEPGWKERNREEAKRMAEEFLNENQDTGWIIDGNYAKFCQERRLEEAHLIVFMDYTRRICLWQAVKRYLEYRDKTRESMAEGCREKIDWDFVKWILRDGIVTSVLIGASRPQQILENLKVLDSASFSEEELKKIDECSLAL